MTRQRPADLPDFNRPPVIEVILSIQVAALPMGNIHAGLFWSRIRDRFPNVSEQPPLPSAFETFGLTPPAVPRIELVATPMASRFWFESEDRRELVQIQPDRLIHNWRKQAPEEDYPRYEPIRAQFLEEIAAFNAFAQEQGFGPLRPNQCEVTYLNHIELPDGGNPVGQLHRILTVWSGETSDGRRHDLDQASLNFRYLLHDGERRLGRLYIGAGPSLRAADMKPLIQLVLTARGKPAEETIESAVDWLDLGRDAIVRGFASITTPEMHKAWERTDA